MVTTKTKEANHVNRTSRAHTRGRAPHKIKWQRGGSPGCVESVQSLGVDVRRDLPAASYSEDIICMNLLQKRRRRNLTRLKTGVLYEVGALNSSLEDGVCVQRGTLCFVYV